MKPIRLHSQPADGIGRGRRLVMLRTGLVALALALAGLALSDPQMVRSQPLRDLLVIIDITRSMNARDMEGQSRLEAVQRILPEVLARLPCGSRIGLGIFTERRSLTFLEPVEICAGYAPLTGALRALDWRMAWEGDSLVARGLIHARARATALGADLVFVTDGQEAPPLPYSGPPPVAGMQGKVGGLIIGVGGAVPVPIPKFDRDGRESGFYRPEDVQQAPARIGAPPADAASRPGYHPRNNPYGEGDLAGEEHLTSLRGAYLADRAEAMGFGYVALSAGPAAVETAMLRHSRPRPGQSRQGWAAIPAATALALLVASYLIGIHRNRIGHRRPGSPPKAARNLTARRTG